MLNYIFLSGQFQTLSFGDSVLVEPDQMSFSSCDITAMKTYHNGNPKSDPYLFSFMDIVELNTWTKGSASFAATTIKEATMTLN